MSEAANLTCAVCGDFFRNPYLLPCDHSFCRRPCLLPTPSTIYARCIYCHIGVHVSQLERNYELDELVQSYLAKHRTLERKRVLCNLCRSLHEHYTTCAHCNRQLCDLCFKEHVDEFHTKSQVQLQRLRNETTQLKEALALLASRRAIGKIQHVKLLKGIESASNDLLSACRTAFSTAKERLNRVEELTEAKRIDILTNQELIGLAVKLLQSLGNPSQHGDFQKLREMRNVAKSALQTLREFETSVFQNGHHQLENLTLTENLKTIGSQLHNLHLVDPGSVAVATGAIICSQSLSQHPTFSVVGSLKASKRTEHKFDREPLLSKHQTEMTKQIASSLTNSVQQQQQSKQQRKDLQGGWTVGRSQQRRIELVVNGVKANITAEDLKAHFASFGEVLDVAMCINPKTNRHNGTGHITLRSTVDVNQILDTEHIILDVRINVRKSKRHLEIYVSGVQAQLTADNLKTHFASFGEVLDIYMCINPKTKKHNGSGYLTLRPTVYWNQVIDAEHIIRGVRINVKECR